MNTTVDKLNSFLRGEISAVETYRQALEKLNDKPEAPTLNDCMRSHEGACSCFVKRSAVAAPSPPRGRGPGAPSRSWSRAAPKVFGEKAAIAALEEGEDHGRDDYQRDVAELDPEARSFLEQSIVPEQVRTHRAMSQLKKRLH